MTTDGRAGVAEADRVLATKLASYAQQARSAQTFVAATEEIAEALSAARESALRGAWVPCSERMPAKGLPVLFVLYGNTRCAGFFDGDCWRDETDPDHFGKPQRERIEDVTHWTPLPALPAPPPPPTKGPADDH